MRFYAYKGEYELGKEPLGTFDKLMFQDINTNRGAHARCRKAFGTHNYRLYTYTNFFDDKTFREI